MEPILLIEVKIPSARVLMEGKLEEAKRTKICFNQLSLVEKKRLNKICHGQLYQKRLKKLFERKILPKEFQERELVLKKDLTNSKGSFRKVDPKL